MNGMQMRLACNVTSAKWFVESWFHLNIVDGKVIERIENKNKVNRDLCKWRFESAHRTFMPTTFQSSQVNVIHIFYIQ